jgi:hypothetical protein
MAPSGFRAVAKEEGKDNDKLLAVLNDKLLAVLCV